MARSACSSAIRWSEPVRFHLHVCTRQEERDDVTLSRNVLPWGGGVDDVVENNARPIGLQVGEQLAAGRQLIRAHDIIDNE